MTQEDTNLLLRDLCARLPYGVICNTDKGNGHLRSIDYTIFGVAYGININPLIRDYFKVQEIKPYLRPMSSMTEEEHKEWRALDNVLKTALEINRLRKDGVEINEAKAISMVLQSEVERSQAQIDWLNSHHFDYRNLIEKGLALKAPEDMYNFE